MGITISRTYEADVDLFGFGVDPDEFNIIVGSIQIGLGTNASDFNDLSAGTLLELVQGSVVAVVEITSRTSVTADVADYMYTLLLGELNFVDAVDGTIEILQVMAESPALQNILFCPNALNYESGRVTEHGSATVISQMTDNDYETYADETDISIDMQDAAGDATPVDFVFIKYTGDLRIYVFTPTGGTGSAFTRIVPTTVTDFNGNTVSLEVDGFKHDLYALPTATTATSVRIQFAGTDVQVYALALLASGLEIPPYGTRGATASDVTPRLANRTGRFVELANGDSRWISGIGTPREKWTVDVQVDFRSNPVTMTAKEFLYWRAKNRNFFFANEFSRNPEEVYPAAFVDVEVGMPYRSTLITNGRRVNFQVAER